MKILLLDNYDSFTFNLVHIVKELGYEIDVVRNDKIALEAVDAYDKILLSPGPGIPEVIDVVADEPLFKGMGNPFMGGRYHSWVVDPENLPECLEVTAIERESRQIMALRHKEYDVKGIQFHPESVLTPNGKTIIENWLKA